MNSRSVKNRFILRCQKTVVALLIFAFLFTDIEALLLLPDLFPAEVVEAAVGDFSIFTEGAGGTALSAGAPVETTWDTANSESANISFAKRSFAF